jgi:hypothetical protein
MNNYNDTIGNRSHDLPVCSAVPQPTPPPCAPKNSSQTLELYYIRRVYGNYNGGSSHTSAAVRSFLKSDLQFECEMRSASVHILMATTPQNVMDIASKLIYSCCKLFSGCFNFLGQAESNNGTERRRNLISDTTPEFANGSCD